MALPPVGAILRLRRKLSEDSTSTWLLVGLGGLMAWVFCYQMLAVMMSVPWYEVLSNPGNTSALSQQNGETFLWRTALALFVSMLAPVVVAVGAYSAYQRQYRVVSGDMVHLDIALMLVDESYGRMIEEWRREHYRPAFNEMPPGNDFFGRFQHVAAYYPHYRLARGQREFSVKPVSQLNCWLDGVLLWCLGSCAPVLIFGLLRVVFTYPRVLATKRAMLEFFDGPWEPAIAAGYEDGNRSPIRIAT